MKRRHEYDDIATPRLPVRGETRMSKGNVRSVNRLVDEEPVTDEERRLVERPTGGYRLYYWTPVQTAKRRADRALQVLRRSELSPVATLVQDLAEWLAESVSTVTTP